PADPVQASPHLVPHSLVLPGIKTADKPTHSFVDEQRDLTPAVRDNIISKTQPQHSLIRFDVREDHVRHAELSNGVVHFAVGRSLTELGAHFGYFHFIDLVLAAASVRTPRKHPCHGDVLSPKPSHSGWIVHPLDVPWAVRANRPAQLKEGLAQAPVRACRFHPCAHGTHQPSGRAVPKDL